MPQSLIGADNRLGDLALATAKWATPVEVKARAFRYGAVWLGRAPDEDETPIGNADDRHMLVVAGSRSGKGASIIVPTLCTWPGSVVVIDPKGENATITAARRGPGSAACDGMGQQVFVFDPMREAKVPDEWRASFNPLDALDLEGDETADEAGRIADSLIVPRNQSDPYWDDQARTLIKALILHIISRAHFEDRRTLLTVRELLTSGDTAFRDHVASIAAEGDTVPSAFQVLFADMSRNRAFGGVVSRAGEAFGHLLDTAAKTFASIASTAANATEFLDSAAMQRVLGSTSAGFSLARIKTDPRGVSVYLSLPQRFMSTHAGWFRMMVSLIVTEMEKVSGRPAAGAPVLMLLDEFAGLKKLEVLEHATAQIAGAGVKLCFVVQTLTQLKAVYGDNWEVFVANAGTRVFFGIDDQFTREYVSKYLGETEIVRTTRTASDTHGRTLTDTSGTTQTTGYSTSTSSGMSTGSSTSSGSGASSDVGLLWNTARTASTNQGSSSTSGTNWGTSSSHSGSSAISNSTADARSQSQTQGLNEAIHKRALITPDEVGVLFERIDDPANHAYPGLALIAARGAPMIVRRIAYYDDALFDRLYTPHPNYPVNVKRGRSLVVYPPRPPETKPKPPEEPVAVVRPPVQATPKYELVGFTFITILCLVPFLGMLNSSQSTEAKEAIAQCDKLVASDYDGARPSGVAGVPYDQVDGQAAVLACEKALALEPSNVRLKFELARGLQKANITPARVADLYYQAAKAGYAIAMTNYGSILDNSMFVQSPNPSQSLYWMHEAAEAGNAVGMLNYGVDLERGYGNHGWADLPAAIFWIRKAADGGHPLAMGELARMLDAGIGTPRDHDAALDWLRRAAKAGDREAQQMLDRQQ